MTNILYVLLKNKWKLLEVNTVTKKGQVELTCPQAIYNL